MTMRAPRTMRTRRRRQRAPLAAARRRCDTADVTTEPDPGPPPEAVFDRLTGPYVRRTALAMPGLAEYNEET
jgi:hypothetical protein